MLYILRRRHVCPARGGLHFDLCVDPITPQAAACTHPTVVFLRVRAAANPFNVPTHARVGDMLFYAALIVPAVWGGIFSTPFSLVSGRYCPGELDAHPLFFRCQGLRLAHTHSETLLPFDWTSRCGFFDSALRNDPSAVSTS